MPTPITCSTFMIIVITIFLIRIVWIYLKKERNERKEIIKHIPDDYIDWDVNAN